MLQAIINYLIFMGVFTCHEIWNAQKLKNGKTWFLITESRGFKAFAVSVATLSFALDLWMGQNNFMSYLVIFGLLYYMKREVGPGFIRIGYGRYTYKGLTRVELRPHDNGTQLIVWYGNKSAQGVVRTGLTNGLEEAVQKANLHIKNNIQSV